MNKNKNTITKDIRIIRIMTIAVAALAVVLIFTAINGRTSINNELPSTQQSVSENTTENRITDENLNKEVTEALNKAVTNQAEIKADEQQETVNAEPTSQAKPTVFNCAALNGSYSATQFETEFFNAINQKRIEAGLSALKWNDATHTMAAVRAKESISSWSHTRPDGTNKSTVLDDFGLASIPMGENLAKGGQLDDETVTAMVDNLMNSDGHRANILNPQATHSAVAAVTDANGKVYVCQLFIVA